MGNDSALVKHESLYFMDGNVVLLVPRPDNARVLFRVHKSVLSRHSPIFSDMFDVCNPPPTTSESEADDFYDGAPLIHLSDNADHLGSVLDILYYQSDLPWMPRNPHYPELITPILDLSRKYGIDRIQAQIVRHLESDWPQTLSDWDKVERDIAAIRGDSDTDRIDDYFPEPAAAIKVAHQFDIPSILPAAFYHLSRLSVLDDWDKTHADPSIDIQNPTRRTARWGLLSGKDYRCLLLGKAELANFLRGCINPGDLRHSQTNRWESCAEGEEIWKDILDKCLQSADPLALLKSMKERKNSKRCQACVNTLTAKIQVVRTQIWEKLGDLFHMKDE
ncbi:hypothetical protein EV363DRAFT_1366836 [Boletus edulis]|nr:hypothetical protein EV363DRAFT_1366836 [Boletus edulis]